LARSLGLEVVAEGVETEDQFRLLLKLGCDDFQGYLFCRSQPAEQIERLLMQINCKLPDPSVSSRETGGPNPFDLDAPAASHTVH
jgi:predicted signal transduction protein with EAL and GGDEF domain